MFGIYNEHCRIEFDPDGGGLRKITNCLLADECLKGGNPEAMPFRIYTDLTKEFEIGLNEKFQLVFDDPATISQRVIQPGCCRLVEEGDGKDLTLRYEGDETEVHLRVALEEHTGNSEWCLSITNTGEVPRTFLASFPYLDGVRPGPDSRANLATAMDQAGLVVPAWDRPGGVLGEGGQMSMQWHAIWDPPSESALGLIIMDSDVRPKRMILEEPSIEVQYFPPVTLAPGESLDLPPILMLVYRGGWRPTAREYRAWFGRAYPTVEPPEWFRWSDGCAGRHFKKGGPGVKGDYGGQFALESLRDLPNVHLRVPVDNCEYAFYSRGSMLQGVHTDGDNVIREDMGGADAMREGITGVHRLGLHATLYVEGYIVHKESELALSGKAERWSVMHKDGTITGPYTKQGFYHMCPGCTDWQDHLAGTVGRLLRETGADGIRLDSLGFYYLPCYNPAHGHVTPFAYNDWIRKLLLKVRKAALAVNPNALLTTEGPADWFGQWFHGALTSKCSRDLPLMRLAVGPYRPYVYTAPGPVWGSVSGFPGGGCGGSDLKTLEGNWMCARFPVHEALVWGDVADEDPRSSDPQIVTRRFEGDDYWAVVAVRPACQDRFEWPWGTGLSDKHGNYILTLSGLAPQVGDAILCDIESLTWTPLQTEHHNNDLLLKLRTNWALVILRQRDGPVVVGFNPLRTLRSNGSTTLRLKELSAKPVGGRQVRALVRAPGLRVTHRKINVPGEVTITVPPDALPGYYGVYVSGKNLLGVKRFLKVE